MTYRDIHRKLNDQPFHPFKIKMVNGTVYEIREPWMIMVGQSSAVIATEKQRDDKGYEFVPDWRTVSIAHMVELVDLEATGQKRKRA